MKTIHGLTEKAFSRLLENMSGAWYKSVEHYIYLEDDVCDIVLNDDCIVKVYDDSLYLDFGGHKESIHIDEMRQFTFL